MDADSIKAAKDKSSDEETYPNTFVYVARCLSGNCTSELKKTAVSKMMNNSLDLMSSA